MLKSKNILRIFLCSKSTNLRTLRLSEKLGILIKMSVVAYSFSEKISKTHVLLPKENSNRQNILLLMKLELCIILKLF